MSAAKEDRLDEERLLAWREHVEARGRVGPGETARERLIAPLDKAIEARPDLVMLHVVRGDALRDLDDLDGARAAYDKAVEVGPHFPETLWARERFRAMEWVSGPPTPASDYAAAYARIAEGSKGIPPSSPAPALAEGFLRHKEGKFDRAIELLEPFSKTHAFDEEIVETVRLATKAQELWAQELGHREADAKKNDLPRVRLVTAKGPVVLELFEDETPNTVANFVWLASSRDGKPGFYDGTTFDKVTPFSVVRGGDPFSREGKADGKGNPGWAIKSERSRRRPFRGMVVVNDDGPDTGGSRFFLLTGTTAFPQDHNTVFGRVIEGQDVGERLLPGDALERVEVVRLRDHEYRPITLAGEPAPEPTARR